MFAASKPKMFQTIKKLNVCNILGMNPQLSTVDFTKQGVTRGVPSPTDLPFNLHHGVTVTEIQFWIPLCLCVSVVKEASASTVTLEPVSLRQN